MNHSKRKLFFLIAFAALAVGAAGQPGSDGSPRTNLGSPTGAVHNKISPLDQPLTPGAYDLTVSASSAGAFYREPLNLGSPNDDQLTRLPPAAMANQSTEKIVSIWQLQHKVPNAAQKARERARDAVRQGRTQDALNEFQNAVSIDPGFTEAYEEWGALYASTGNLTEAVEQFRRALGADPNSHRALSSLCVILGRLGELEEAGQVARRALQLDPGNTGVHYVLAISLMNTPGESVQALNHLQRAVSGVPMAHLAAAQILIANGRRAEARQHLKEYLAVASGDEIHKSPVDSLLQQLQE
jgi:Flp pilus assembly protein TadD